jgi:arylsulfatase A-like enzyme
LQILRARSLVLFGWCLLLISCRRGDYTVDRPWFGATDLEPVSYQGTTMLARHIARRSDPEEIALGTLGPSDVLFYAALEGPPGSHATIDLAQSGTNTCTVVDARRWQVCRFAVARAVAEARLSVRIEGAPEAHVVLSSPMVRSAATSKRPNVIVVLADTLRFDRLVSYAPNVPLGSHIDALARDGVVFERVHSSSTWTRTAVASLFTGLEAAGHGVLSRTDALPPSLDGLPRALQRAGYRTFAWSTNPNVLPVWGFDAGFDVFHDLGTLAWPKEKIHAGTVFAAVQEALEDPDLAPAFLYVHLLDPHFPYLPEQIDLEAVAGDARLVETFPGRERKPTIEDYYRKYLAEIRGMDRALGKFFDELRTLGFYDDAMILLVSDHGEEFLDHGGIRHGRTLYEEVLRVPVILKLPGNALAGMRLQSDVGMSDLAPTLLGALGLDGLKISDGRNLWDAEKHTLREESRAQSALLKMDIYHQAAVVTGSRKLIVDYRGSDQMFDLEADPRELRNLVAEPGSEAASLRSILDSRIARHQAGWHVRACGNDRDLALSLRIDARGEAHGSQLEKEDSLRLVARRGDDAEYRAELRLSPRRIPRPGAGSVAIRPDEDEVVLPSADADSIAIASIDGRAFRYSLGAAEDQLESLEIAPRSADPAARLARGAAADCRPPVKGNDEEGAASASARPAYLRIWYVPPPPAEQRPASEVDPEVHERLRALGYAE